jgi:hypothetical protein
VDSAGRVNRVNPKEAHPRSNNMTPHAPEEHSTRLIDWRPFVFTGNSTPPGILMQRMRKKRKTTKSRTAPTNRRSCASKTKSKRMLLEL